jgi:hypothetical protein
MARTDEHGGIDYGIRRTGDGMYLSSPNNDGESLTATYYADEASAFETEAEALSFAALAGVASDPDSGEGDPVLDEGYELVEIPWTDEDDIEKDDIDEELDEEEA